jgi:type III secretion protein R
MNVLLLGATDASLIGGQPVTMIITMALLSLIPFVVLLMTSFVKISVVLSILKSAIGAPQIPPSQVITGLAFILTIYVMAPVGERMLTAAAPLFDKSATPAKMIGDASVSQLTEAVSLSKEPLREFMLKHATPKDRAVFLNLARRMREPAERTAIMDRDFLVLTPAFLTSELTRAFRIGFLLFVPFLIVDMVIANLLLALGMHMLSPTTVSLPFKLLLFVLADGWHLLLSGLVQSYV